MNNTFKPYYFADFHSSQIENIVKPLKITQYTIIIPGIKQYSDYDFPYKLNKLEFRCKHSKKTVKIVDSIITPEMIILYVNKDTRQYPYNKCVLISKLDLDTVSSKIYEYYKSTRYKHKIR